MKQYLLVFVFCTLFSCQNDNEEAQVSLTASTLLGSWQLSSTYISPGGATEWMEVENGDILKFVVDGTFDQRNTVDGNFDRSGSYVLVDDLLNLTYVTEGEETTQSYHVEMAKNTVTLSPAGPIFCIEPCLYRYRKID